ncbi:MAG: 50S ribosomal protein L6 [Candidatus Paceibacterota bacterium]|jgi:large subunit ribosomal protein L6
MSRVGKQIIEIPAKVEVTLSTGTMRIKGPLGELTREFKDDIEITIADKQITLKPKVETIFTRSLWGTYAAHIINMIKGVTEGYMKKMTIEGVGYKVELKGTQLVFALGFSHPVPMDIPKGIKAVVEKNVLTISGPDKDLVGLFSAQIVAHKPPEPYKGKGIIYAGTVVRRKQGKRSVA